MKGHDSNPIYYVYIHFRKDDGSPFYVGKGKNKRAFEGGSRRSKRWNWVVEKHGHTVDFAFVGMPEEDAFLIERFFIVQFRSEGYPMVNMTDGGEGSNNKEQVRTNKEQILDLLFHLGRLPRVGIESERRLCNAMRNYCCKDHVCYDPEFESKIRPFIIVQDSTSLKQEIRDFLSLFNRFPSKSIPSEKHLGRSLIRYCSPAQNSYDPEFHQEMTKLGYGGNRGRRSDLAHPRVK